MAYFLVPYLTGSTSGLGDAFVTGAVEFTGFPLVNHAVVLVVVTNGTAVAAVVAARRR